MVRAQTVQKLTFYYPVAVGGPLAAIIDGFCSAYQKETGVAVEAVYAGDYSQTLIKTTTAIKGGGGPHFAVLLAAEMHSLQDQDILVSLDEIGLDAEAKQWLGRILSGVPGQQPRRWQDLVGAVPALDRDILLQQGGVSRRRASTPTNSRRRGTRSPRPRRNWCNAMRPAK